MSRFVSGNVTCAGFLSTLRLRGARGCKRRGLLGGGILVSLSVVGLSSVPVLLSVSGVGVFVVGMEVPAIGCGGFGGTTKRRAWMTRIRGVWRYEGRESWGVFLPQVLQATLTSFSTPP